MSLVMVFKTELIFLANTLRQSGVQLTLFHSAPSAQFWANESLQRCLAVSENDFLLAQRTTDVFRGAINPINQ